MIALTANISNAQNTVYSGLIYWPKYSFFHCVKKSTVYICSVLTTKMRLSGYPNKRKSLVNGNLEPLKTFMLLQKVTVQKPFLLSWPILKWQKIFICKFFFAISSFAIIDEITSAQLAAFWFFSFIHLKSNVLDYSL